MKQNYMYQKAKNLHQLVHEYEKERRQHNQEITTEIIANNEYMTSLALDKLQYQKEQEELNMYCCEFVVDLLQGSFDQRMRVWTSIYYENLKAQMCNLYLNEDLYRITPLWPLITVMKEPKKHGGYRFGVDYRKFYDRYVKS